MTKEFAQWLVRMDDKYIGTAADVVDNYAAKSRGGEQVVAVATDDPVNLLLSAIWGAVDNPGAVPYGKPDEFMVESFGKLQQIIY